MFEVAFKSVADAPAMRFNNIVVFAAFLFATLFSVPAVLSTRLVSFQNPVATGGKAGCIYPGQNFVQGATVDSCSFFKNLRGGYESWKSDFRCCDVGQLTEMSTEYELR